MANDERVDDKTGEDVATSDVGGKVISVQPVETESTAPKPNRSKMMMLIVASLLVAAVGTLLAIKLTSNSINTQTAEIRTAFDNLIIPQDSDNPATLENVELLTSGEVIFSLAYPLGGVGSASTIEASGVIVFDANGAALELDLIYDGLQYGADLTFVNTEIFLRVSGIDSAVEKLLLLDPEVATNAEIFSLFNAYEDIWISVDTSSLDEFGLAGIEESAPTTQQLDETSDEFLDLLIGSGAFEITSLDKEMSLGSDVLTGYLISVDPDKTEQLLEDLVELAKKDASPSDVAELEESLAILPELFGNDTGELPFIELWTDGTFIRHIQMGEQGSAAFSSITLNKVNNSPVIEAPAPKFTFDEVVTDILSVLLGTSEL